MQVLFRFTYLKAATASTATPTGNFLSKNFIYLKSQPGA